MATLNTLACLTTAGNTGKEACAFLPANITGVLLTPKGYILNQTQIAALQASLIAAVQNPSKGARVFPIYGFETPNDNSEDITVQTTGYGGKHVVKEGYNDWKYDYVDGGVTLHKNIRLLNGNSHDFLFIDANNTIIGTAGTGSDGFPGLKAIPCDGGFFWAHPWKANDGSKVTTLMIQFVFHPKYMNEYLAFVKADFDIATTAIGLVDVTLTSPSVNATSGSYNVVAKTAGVGTNLGDIYPAELAIGTSWLAKDENGLNIPVLSSTYNAAINGYVIALDKASANYPTVAGKKVTITGNTPAILTTNGVAGYEFGAVSIVKN